MLFSLIKKLLQNVIRTKIDSNHSDVSVSISEKLERAGHLMKFGLRQQAIELFRDVLRNQPENTHAMNDLACALGDVRQIREAAELFVKAYTLDERFLPAIINHAALLMENRDNTAALDIIHLAKIAEPDFVGINSAYATYLFSEGMAVDARPYKLKDWLANFDSLRAANAYLFYCTYDHSLSEESLTAEHMFWADTQVESSEINSVVEELPSISVVGGVHGRKIRIGYLSPDLKDHSVKYFFRPLLRSHDASNFDIFLYDDAVVKDGDTLKIKSDNQLVYNDISGKSDVDLIELIRCDQLDVLVELAGHTSHNRISLFGKRLAGLQISALGYPPTTGLVGMDLKLMDPWIVYPGADKFYAETPLVLPQSFWCFDPIDHVDAPGAAPHLHNGFITFGCQGNIAKISDKVLDAWAEILRRCSGSRLLIRSINFRDKGVCARFQSRLAQHGIERERVQLHGPAVTAEFFRSYDQIDIMLDTFPFNGGTTTAFGLYMGVAMVSMAGEALPSRMGRSMLSNLGLNDLVVDGFDEYVEAAISLAHDSDRLVQFRSNARQLFASCALGNGDIFTRQFENSIRAVLNNPPVTKKSNELPCLPCNELVRRAYAALSYLQPEASERIAFYCLKRYPTSGLAHVLASNMLSRKGDLMGAFNYLLNVFSSIDFSDQLVVKINLMRLALMLPQSVNASNIFDDRDNDPVDDPVEALQVNLLRLAYATSVASFPLSHRDLRLISSKINFLIFICTDDSLYFEYVKNTLMDAWVLPDGVSCVFICVNRNNRIQIIRSHLEKSENQSTIVVQLQSDAIPMHPDFLVFAHHASLSCDVTSYSGSEIMDRIDWHHSPFLKRHGLYFSSSIECEGFVEAQFMGMAQHSVEKGMVVLSGKLLVYKPTVWLESFVDETLLNADCLMEEVWTHGLATEGKVLGVSHRFGVSIEGEVNPLIEHLTTARNAVVEQLGLQVFAEPDADRLLISVPCHDLKSGMHLVDVFFGNK